jgi:diacylglycerol kinase family enzyme
MLHSHVPLAILPAGTANVLACEMRINSLTAAVERLASSAPRRIAVGRLTSEAGVRHFLLMAGIGLDAHIVYRVNAALKARTGKFAYWVAGWSLVGRSLPEFVADVDGREHRCSFALIARVRNYGGTFEIARETTLFENEFEVVLFEGRNAARYVKYFVGMTTNRLAEMAGVTVLRARRVALSHADAPSVYVQIDGEFASRLPAQVEIVPDALTLMAPEQYAAFSERGRERQQHRKDR